MPPSCVQSSKTDLAYFNKSFLITLWEMLMNYQEENFSAGRSQKVQSSSQGGWQMSLAEVFKVNWC